MKRVYIYLIKVSSKYLNKKIGNTDYNKRIILKIAQKWLARAVPKNRRDYSNWTTAATGGYWVLIVVTNKWNDRQRQKTKISSNRRCSAISVAFDQLDRPFYSVSLSLNIIAHTVLHIAQSCLGFSAYVHLQSSSYPRPFYGLFSPSVWLLLYIKYDCLPFVVAWRRRLLRS
jgi:hypothetical protein